MNYYIITGASKGLGNALARKLIEQSNNHLFCISRTKDNQLISEAKENKVELDYLEFDLRNVRYLKDIFEKIREGIKEPEAESIVLINNAGVIEPVKPVQKMEYGEIHDSYQINLIAPVLLSNLFAKAFQHWKCDRKIINITSGAAGNPYHGWGLYSSAKAGINLLTQSMGIEQDNHGNPMLVHAFSPGLVNTQMQDIIRSKTEEDFEQVSKFHEFNEKGMLQNPQDVASRLLKLNREDKLEQGGVSHISDY